MNHDFLLLTFSTSIDWSRTLARLAKSCLLDEMSCKNWVAEVSMDGDTKGWHSDELLISGLRILDHHQKFNCVSLCTGLMLGQLFLGMLRLNGLIKSKICREH